MGSFGHQRAENCHRITVTIERQRSLGSRGGAARARHPQPPGLAQMIALRDPSLHGLEEGGVPLSTEEAGVADD